MLAFWPAIRSQAEDGSAQDCLGRSGFRALGLRA